MRIAWLVAGPRGDVQPAAVAAETLQRRGHDVVLAAPEDLMHLGAALGVATASLGIDVRAFLQSEEGAAWLADGDVRRYLAGLLDHKQQHLAELTRGLLSATEGADVVVGGGLLREEAAALASLRHAALVLPGYAPRYPNRAYPPIGLPQHRVPGLVNAAEHQLVALRTGRLGRPYAAAFRESLGLPPTRRSPDGGRGPRPPQPQLYSRHLVPRLTEEPGRPLLGFVRPTAAHHAAWDEPGVDQDLEAWLEDGPPPVWFGFGSMAVDRRRDVLGVVRRAAETLGIRALVGVGRDDGGRLAGGVPGDQVRVVGEIDHGAVLPACAAAVHHGGAGTTAASVLAGLPTLVCAVAFDQPFWGERLTELGIGASMPFTAMTEDALVARLRPLLDPGVVRRGAGRRRPAPARTSARGAGRAGRGPSAPVAATASRRCGLAPAGFRSSTDARARSPAAASTRTVPHRHGLPGGDRAAGRCCCDLGGERAGPPRSPSTYGT